MDNDKMNMMIERGDGNVTTVEDNDINSNNVGRSFFTNSLLSSSQIKFCFIALLCLFSIIKERQSILSITQQHTDIYLLESISSLPVLIPPTTSRGNVSSVIPLPEQIQASQQSPPRQARAQSQSQSQVQSLPDHEQTNNEKKKRGKYAIAFIIAGCSWKEWNGMDSCVPYILNAIVTAHVLRTFQSSIAVVLKVRMSAVPSNETSFADFSPEIEDWLSKAGITLQYLPRVRHDNFGTASIEMFRILEMIDYDRVLFLDSDSYPTCNIDQHFDLSYQGILEETIGFPGTAAPITAAALMVTPKVGAFGKVMDIIHRERQRQRQQQQQQQSRRQLQTQRQRKRNSKAAQQHRQGQRQKQRQRQNAKSKYPLDPIKGWGHAIVNKEGRVVKEWTWHAVEVDQGIIYEWLMHEIKNFTLIQNHKNYSTYQEVPQIKNNNNNNNNNTNQMISFLASTTPSLSLACSGTMGDGTGIPSSKGTISKSIKHFPGGSKPWKGSINGTNNNLSESVAGVTEHNNNQQHPNETLFRELDPQQKWRYWLGEANRTFQLQLPSHFKLTGYQPLTPNFKASMLLSPEVEIPVPIPIPIPN